MSTTGPKISVVDSIPDGATYGDDGRAFLRMFQALIQANVINLTTSTPPGSPSNGDTYVVDPTGSGAWLGKDQYIAYWSTDNPNAPSGEWEFYQPLTGWIIGNRDDQTAYIFNGSTWTAIGGGGGSGTSLYASNHTGTAYTSAITGNGTIGGGGTATYTVPVGLYNAAYNYGAVATNSTASRVIWISNVTGDTITFSGTNGDNFYFFVFPQALGS